MRKITLVAVSLLMLGAGGCSSLGVEPWEKGQFARSDMALDRDRKSVV